MSRTIELNLDGLVGPTHHYGGLSFGNVASMTHTLQVSHPRAAALQGLEKMKRLADLGLPQAVLPPHERPDLGLLRQCGFTGKDHEVLAQAAKQAPNLLSCACSSAAMWTANAATVSASSDTQDGRVHITPANLVSYLHRCREADTYTRLFHILFPSNDHFVIHPPLPHCNQLADEGAANHVRLASSHAHPGVTLLVYGRTAAANTPKPTKFPARQTHESAVCLARQHQLTDNAVVLLQQNPAAIDAGVFHNDVISVGNENVLFFHEDAFVNAETSLEKIRTAYEQRSSSPLHFLQINRSQLSLRQIVGTYLFNSQLVTLPQGGMALICPSEVQEHNDVRAVVEALIEDENPLQKVLYVNLKQSMRNGGGPACLRLRMILSGVERAAIHTSILLTDALYSDLVSWIKRWYREELKLEDLADPQLLEETRTALDELTQRLSLGNLYSFQH